MIELNSTFIIGFTAGLLLGSILMGLLTYFLIIRQIIKNENC